MSSTSKSCPRCGKPWWDGWEKCPHCGTANHAPAPARQAEASPAGTLAGIGIIAVVVVVVALIAGRLPDPTKPAPSSAAPPTPSHSVDGAWTVCTDAVRDRLKAPSAAKFPWGYDDKVTHLGEGKYRARAYVDAQNAYGAMLRTSFDCTVQWVGGDRWRLEELMVE